MKPTKWRFETLLELIQKNDYLYYLEIGIGSGKTMSYLMQNIGDPDFRFYGIDPYKAYGDLHKKGLRFKQDRFDANKRVVENLFWSDGRGKFINEYAHIASETFEDNFFDIIFIDGNHTEDYVLQDMKDWYPKLREGGTFAGHDYYPVGHHYHCVSKAVDKFAKEQDKKVLVAPDHVWYFKK
jgi:hypothetical protein